MKRWIPMLILTLLLCGCDSREPIPSTPPETTDPTTVSTEPAATQPPVDNSAPLNHMIPGEDYSHVASMGENLLLIGKDTLSVWHFGSNTPTYTENFANLPTPDSGAMQVSDEQIVYFDAAENAVIYLSNTLQQTRKLQLKETVLGDVYLTADCTKMYFCTADGIRVWDLKSGICQNLKLQPGNWLGIRGALLSESALCCQLQQEDGTVRSMLISTTTGETLYEGDALLSLSGSGQFYCYASREEWIFGHAHQQKQLLMVEDAIALPQIQAAYTLADTADGLEIHLYDLNTGLRTAALLLENTEHITGVTAFDGYLWFWADGSLCRWDSSLSPTGDDTVYTAKYYTAEEPDLEGLSAYRDKASALGRQYGIEILIWTDSPTLEPAGYTFEVEYRTDVYAQGFAALEAALALFPEDLINRAADWTEDGTLRIALVQSIGAPEESVYSGSAGMEYLLDGKVCIALELGENLEQSFYHSLFHVMDPLILSNSIAYYKWNDLNPSGFRYDNDYAANRDRDGSQYLEEGKEYFIDTFSMSFAVEDRARIFEYAMMPGNESYFTSKTMQAKLKMLCKGLREVFELEEESYIWEQYLN